MGSPFFSIIIPAYNVADFIRGTISAILSQSFTDWELIIADDASTDSTPEILDYFRHDERIKILLSDKNSGNPFIPRKKASDVASGQYIVTVDADDLIDSTLLARIFETIMNEKADLVIPEMWRFSDSVDESFYILPKKEFDSSKLYRGKELVKFTLNGWTIPMAGFGVRREIYKEAYSRIQKSESDSIHADELLSRHLLILSQRVRFIDSKYFYRLNRNSVTGDPARLIRSGISTNRSLIKLCEAEFGKNSEEYKRALLQKTLFLLSSVLLLKNSGLPRSEKNSLIRAIESERLSTDISPVKDIISLPYRLIWRLPYKLEEQAMTLISLIKHK